MPRHCSCSAPFRPNRARLTSDFARVVAALVPCIGFLFQATTASPQVKATRENTLTYNHKSLTANRAEPYVLSVEDGGFFQVVFCETDPTRFSYTVSAIRNDQLEDAGTSVELKPVQSVDLRRTAVTMRHDRGIYRYRIRIARIDGGDTPVESEAAAATEDEAAQALEDPAFLENLLRAVEPDKQEMLRKLLESRKGKRDTTAAVKLYPVSFDVWVQTRGWEVSFTAGLAFSNLTDARYYLNDMGTADTADDLIQRDSAAEDNFRPEIMALANVRYPQRLLGIGIAFGLGTDGSEQRYFLGPSYVFGKHFIFAAGWTGGRVSSLPTGQREDKPPINGANTLDGLQTRFASGFYAGIGFTFAPRKDAFLDALTASTGVTGTPNARPTISAIPDPDPILAGASTPEIAFTVNDDRTKPEVLTLSARSRSPEIVPPDSIVFGGTGSARTLKVTSKAGASGTAEITITANDGS